jgi:hypothetical protein
LNLPSVSRILEGFGVETVRIHHGEREKNPAHRRLSLARLPLLWRCQPNRDPSGRHECKKREYRYQHRAAKGSHDHTLLVDILAGTGTPFQFCIPVLRPSAFAHAQIL